MVLPSSRIIVAFWIVAIVVILTLYIAIGPLLIGVALFPATRSILERWIGSLISCVILQITTFVLLYIVLAVEQQARPVAPTRASKMPDGRRRARNTMVTVGHR